MITGYFAFICFKLINEDENRNDISLIVRIEIEI